MGNKILTSITTTNGLVQSGTSLTAGSDGVALIRDAGALVFPRPDLGGCGRRRGIFSTEDAQDAAAAMIAAGTHSGITFSYNDVAGSLSATVTGGGSLDIDGLTLTDAAVADTVPLYDASAAANRKLSLERLGGFVNQEVCQGRLTLTSGTPVTISDVTGAGTVYFTPYAGNRIALYDGSRWILRTFAELSLSLSGLASTGQYDIFAYDNAGTVTLERGTAWTSGDTRNVALAVQDGIYVLAGSTTRLYLGTLRISSLGTTEDSDSKRFLWNYYNRRHRRLALTVSGIHTYTSGTVRAWNNDTTNRVGYVAGIAEDAIPVQFAATSTPLVDGQAATTGVGFDSTSSFADSGFAKLDPTKSAGKTSRVGISTVQLPALGYHFLHALESSHTTSPYSEFNNFSLFAEVWG